MHTYDLFTENGKRPYITHSVEKAFRSLAEPRLLPNEKFVFIAPGLIRVKVACGEHIVVTLNENAIFQRTAKRNGLFGKQSVPDEIARDDEFVVTFFIQFAERRLKGEHVRVDIGNNRDPHLFRFAFLSENGNELPFSDNYLIESEDDFAFAKSV